MTRVTGSTTFAELATILADLGATSITVDLASRRVLVTLTCPIETSAASGEAMPEAIDLAIVRLTEARALQARVNALAGSLTPDQAAKIAGNLTLDQAAAIGRFLRVGPSQLHPTAVRCTACGAYAANDLAHQRDLERIADREGRLGFVNPAFVVRAGSEPGAYRVMLCNTLVTGPTRVVDGREYHEVRCVAAERASAQMTGAEPAVAP